MPTSHSRAPPLCSSCSSECLALLTHSENEGRSLGSRKYFPSQTAPQNRSHQGAFSLGLFPSSLQIPPVFPSQGLERATEGWRDGSVNGKNACTTQKRTVVVCACNLSPLGQTQVDPGGSLASIDKMQDPGSVRDHA